MLKRNVMIYDLLAALNADKGEKSDGTVMVTPVFLITNTPMV